MNQLMWMQLAQRTVPMTVGMRQTDAFMCVNSSMHRAWVQISVKDFVSGQWLQLFNQPPKPPQEILTGETR